MAKAATAPTKPTEVEKTPPVHRATLGSVDMAVWANPYTNERGERKIMYTTTMDRSYLDRNQVWQKSTAWRDGDLANVEVLSQRARQFILEQQAQET